MYLLTMGTCISLHGMKNFKINKETYKKTLKNSFPQLLSSKQNKFFSTAKFNSYFNIKNRLNMTKKATPFRVPIKYYSTEKIVKEPLDDERNKWDEVDFYHELKTSENPKKLYYRLMKEEYHPDSDQYSKEHAEKQATKLNDAFGYIKNNTIPLGYYDKYPASKSYTSRASSRTGSQNRSTSSQEENTKSTHTSSSNTQSQETSSSKFDKEVDEMYERFKRDIKNRKGEAINVTLKDGTSMVYNLTSVIKIINKHANKLPINLKQGIYRLYTGILPDTISEKNIEKIRSLLSNNLWNGDVGVHSPKWLLRRRLKKDLNSYKDVLKLFYKQESFLNHRGCFTLKEYTEDYLKTLSGIDFAKIPTIYNCFAEIHALLTLGTFDFSIIREKNHGFFYAERFVDIFIFQKFLNTLEKDPQLLERLLEKIIEGATPGYAMKRPLYYEFEKNIDYFKNFIGGLFGS